MEKEIRGLTTVEVNQRIKLGKVNYNEEPKTLSIKEIIKKHTFTFFNYLNVVLGALVLISGVISGQFLYGLKNCLFMGVIFWNTIISTVEEILAKRTIDKLNIISESKINVIRNGEERLISKEEIVLDDICKYEIGSQVITDCEIIKGNVEVNESFITGEEKTITKKAGDIILSGSFIISGTAYVKATSVGKDNYVAKITNEAKYIKKTNSVIYNSFDQMLKILGFCLVFIGIFFLINQLSITDFNVPNSIMSTVSALIGMIPEGLVLLTSSAMAVSVLRLRRFKVLVQDLYSIENLARVDVICLDKTGTLTEGDMEVKKIIPYKKESMEKIKDILGDYTKALDDKSPTFLALKKFCGSDGKIETEDVLPFSSERKYSGVSFKDINYYLGSPENLLKKEISEIKDYQDDYRVLVLTSSKDKFKDISKINILGFVLIQDRIKKNAKETLDYFKKQGVDIKIISGDNDKTVAKIARQIGMSDIKSIDFSKVEDSEIPNIISEYNILGRVKPDQKKKIIKALKHQGHFVAMTGDGVNDCMALKESDCSIAMASGSDAAKNVSQFVLLDSKIDNLPEILKEGRRSINNIERSSCLLLSKTIFTIILIIACLILRTEYFFIPIHLTLITTFTIGIPSFILALEKNNNIVKGNFLQKVFLKSFPAALTVVFNIIIIKLFEMQFGLDSALCDTLNVFLTAATGFIFLDHLCRPYNYLRACLIIILLIAFGYCSIYAYSFFNISYINQDTILVFVVLFICSLFIFDKLKLLSNYLLKKTDNI